MPFDRFSMFSRLVRVTAFVLRFTTNCRSKKPSAQGNSNTLTVQELNQATCYWIKMIQNDTWHPEIDVINKGSSIRRTSRILSLDPFLDKSGILRVGGRHENAKAAYDNRHPMILPANHPLVKLRIGSEHLHLLHAGHLLTSASLSRRFHIVGGHKAVRAITRSWAITRSCVVCRRRSTKPTPQMMGQLPKERVTPDVVFNKVGIDYAGSVTQTCHCESLCVCLHVLVHEGCAH